MTEWQTYVAEQRETELNKLIIEEKLKPEETRKFLDNSFRDGAIKEVGTDIDKIMPPVSRFGGGNRTQKKQTILQNLKPSLRSTLALVVTLNSSKTKMNKKQATVPLL